MLVLAVRKYECRRRRRILQVVNPLGTPQSEAWTCPRFAEPARCAAGATHPSLGGHIHHIDNIFGFEGLYSCSAGCHPGGSVIGAAGHNAAMAIADATDRSVSPARPA